MPNPVEFNKKIEISVGAIVFMIVATFVVTSVYFQTTNNDEVQEKQNEVQELTLGALEAELEEIKKQGTKLALEVIENTQAISGNSNKINTVDNRLSKKIKIIQENTDENHKQNIRLSIIEAKNK